MEISTDFRGRRISHVKFSQDIPVYARNEETYVYYNKGSFHSNVCLTMTNCGQFLKNTLRVPSKPNQYLGKTTDFSSCDGCNLNLMEFIVCVLEVDLFNMEVNLFIFCI